MSTAVEETQAHVRRLLGDDGHEVHDEGDGTLAVELGGRRLRLDVLPLGPDEAAVQVLAPLVVDVADSDDLCEAVATTPLRIGKLLVLPGTDDHLRTVVVVHRFVGDGVAPEVLRAALDVVAALADELDPVLEARFGATWTLEGPEAGTS